MHEVDEKEAGGDAHICVELAHKRGEVLMLELLWQHIVLKLRVIPDREAASTRTGQAPEWRYID